MLYKALSWAGCVPTLTNLQGRSCTVYCSCFPQMRKPKPQVVFTFQRMQCQRLTYNMGLLTPKLLYFIFLKMLGCLFMPKPVIHAQGIFGLSFVKKNYYYIGIHTYIDTVYNAYISKYVCIYIFTYHHKEIFPAKDLSAHVLCQCGLGCEEACCHGYFDNPHTLCYV